MHQIIVSTGDLRARIDRWIVPKSLQRLTRPGRAAGSPARSPRPNLSSDYVAPRDESEQAIATVLQEVLGLEQIGIYDNFFDLGGDSLSGIQAAYLLTKELKTQIQPVVLYRSPTVSALTEWLRQDEEQIARQERAKLSERREAILQRKQRQQKRRSQKRSQGRG